MSKQILQLFEPKSSSLLYEEAKKLGLKPKWETDYGLFSVCLEADKSYREFFFHTNLNLNGARARVLAKNKQFTRLVLAKYNFPNIPYLFPRNFKQLEDFFSKHQLLICKPLLGDRSRQVYFIKTQQELKQCSIKMNIFEKYIKGIEYRCLVLEQEVIALQKKTLETNSAHPWDLYYENIDKQQWRDELLTMALQIAKIMHLRLAGIDFIVDENSQSWILEVNSSPGITKIHQPDKGRSINAANKIWKAVLKNYKSPKSS